MSLPTKEGPIYDYLKPLLTTWCTAKIVFDGPPMYEVPRAQYPFGVVHFEEARFERVGGGGAVKSVKTQQQVYKVSLWCVRKIAEGEQLWANLRAKGAAVKVAIELDPKLGGAATWTEVTGYAPDNAITDLMRKRPDDVAAMRIDLEITCQVLE